MVKNELAKQVLESCAGSAAHMSHALSVYGDGDMGVGIIKYGADNKNCGIAQGAVSAVMLITLGIGGVLLHKHYHNKPKDNQPETVVADITSTTDMKI